MSDEKRHCVHKLQRNKNVTRKEDVLLDWVAKEKPPLQSWYLNTEQHKHRINAHNTDIHSLSGIRTHYPSVRAS
jgi:hypothetical protein